MSYELDDFVMPIGLDKGKKLKDIPLRQIDKFLGWLEDHKVNNTLQETLAQYLKDNKYTGEDEDS